MSASIASIQSSHPTNLDGEIAALTLQLEEIGIFSDARKGKHAVDNPPDAEIAFANFQAELEEYKRFLDDQKLAQSIGAAVYADAATIADLNSQDVQAHDDRMLALRMSNDDPEIQKPPRSVQSQPQDAIHEWMAMVSESVAGNSVVDFSDDEVEAGPSMTYAERQREFLGKLSRELQCVVCTGHFRPHLMVATKCSHRYCIDCMKELFVRSIRDEGLYPPRCCKQPIPLSHIARHMAEDELAAFKLASAEYTTENRTYCSNRECNAFITTDCIEPGTHRALCGKCGTTTCAICKEAYHSDTDCPDDPDLRLTRQLANDMGWKACYACNRIVVLRSGCNHMTCVCKAQFCYVCGAKWKSCRCPEADLNRIEERAEEVVDRDAPPDLPFAERQRRVREVRDNLQDNHECEHSRRFQRMFNPGRRGFRCELCDDRHWKYILQCRHCYINVCEDCRRNRI